jgi:uncharacterized protein
MQNDFNRLFPVFLKLENLNLLLVGAGNVGAEKLNAVLQNAPSTNITIVSKEISEAARNLAIDFPNVQLLQKEFTEHDLENKDLVIVAINNKTISNDIRNAAKAARLLVNVADTPDLCDFYLGAIVQKGDVKIAISTNGKSPTLAKRIKEVLNDFLPGNLHQLANNLNAIRDRLKGNFSEKVKKLNELTSMLREE